MIVPGLRARSRYGRGLAPDVDGIAVTQGPGLVGSLLVGLLGRQGDRPTRRGKPLVGVNHLEGHIFAAFLEEQTRPSYPFVALVVSGGHTALYAARPRGRYRVTSGRRVTTPPARPSTRWPSSSGSAIRAGPVIERMAATR